MQDHPDRCIGTASQARGSQHLKFRSSDDPTATQTVPHPPAFSTGEPLKPTPLHLHQEGRKGPARGLKVATHGMFVRPDFVKGGSIGDRQRDSIPFSPLQLSLGRESRERKREKNESTSD
mmetsp:Transcript_15851/g.32186  ORF Transcript_15851/g.32186 Transcript_15851/m.32186 type:complete len:120 (+) Transcript_15851:250-609(+)